MYVRIRDPRIIQAQSGGTIAGMSHAFSEQVALIADLLSYCHIWSDVTCMFPQEVSSHAPDIWEVPVAQGWVMLFQWQPPWGPVELLLYK